MKISQNNTNDIDTETQSLLLKWYSCEQSDKLFHEIFPQRKLEWGCPNGTKYPPRQPIPNRAILPNRAHVYRQTDRQTDGQGDSSIPPPLTSLRGYNNHVYSTVTSK